LARRIPLGTTREAAAAATASAQRDVALDLLRGLAMTILVVNHIHLESALEYATATFVSAAEVLVAVSGVVAGMVYGRRWRSDGPRRTTAALLRRSRKLYLASVGVVVIVGMVTLVPGVASEAATASPRAPAQDLYAFDGPLRMLLAVATLEAGPWQTNILGLFIAVLALTPAVLWALSRGWWPGVVAASLTAFAVGRAWPVDVLPFQSERPFPFLVWQALFVHGLVLGWHRARIEAALRANRRLVVGAIVALATLAAFVQLQRQGLNPVGVDALVGYGPTEWARFSAAHFDKTTLDPLRLLTLLSLTAAIYVAARRFAEPVGRALGWFLLPLGRNSLYVFIVHVFLCLAVASIFPLAGDGIGVAASTLVQLACLTALWIMVRRRFLFRWIPR
jgi:hypothetical protein